jgi:cAMP phosphodiesterase
MMIKYSRETQVWGDRSKGAAEKRTSYLAKYTKSDKTLQTYSHTWQDQINLKELAHYVWEYRVDRIDMGILWHEEFL